MKKFGEFFKKMKGSSGVSTEEERKQERDKQHRANIDAAQTRDSRFSGRPTSGPIDSKNAN